MPDKNRRLRQLRTAFDLDSLKYPVCGAVEKLSSASLRSSFVIAAYKQVRLIPHDFVRLASERF
jgi:hypothetical protein